MTLSPIVLFVYNRPWHTKQTLEALKKNDLACESELFIYSDAAKNSDTLESVNEVRKYINQVDGFKKVTVIIRENNWGLADSIIDGVTEIINRYGKVIVLEDDLVTSPYFLKFMNEALDFYQDEKKVWHISGWNYPIETNADEDVFFWRAMNCWGWATWDDRWKYYEKDIDKAIKEFSRSDIKRFNLDGVENFFGQVIANKNKKINTWAIFWYITLFKNDGLCLNPTKSYVENIGLDGSGEHCGNSSIFSTNYRNSPILNFDINIKENNFFLEKIKDYYKMNKKTKLQIIINRAKKIYLNEQFNPSLLGIFINPFYISRKSLATTIIGLLPNLKGTILDVGCGTKPYEKYCQANKYIGLELNNENSQSRKKADYYYDGDEMPFESSSIDSVLTSQVFEHVFTPHKFLQEIHRVLKEDGILLLSVPLVWDEHEQPYDYARYTSFGLIDILKENGFEVIILKKTANNFSVIVQLLTAYIHKMIFGKNRFINSLFIFLVIAPIHIIGLLLSKLLPNNDDLYLDNVVLAKKIKHEN